MRLKALHLHGFKSFADRTDIEFHPGMTAIVGPNGCGKSNISDAIRWVLGEQRPSAIRGARMEEAIFQGTVARRPVNRGSVTMVLTNEEGLFPVPFREVELTRTVYREGGSEYALNRSPCRLRDILDLCRDTGLGANAYAVIESRMIDAILSDRAEERRGLFEEAAGIGKYKDRRLVALRRLEAAELDLARLDDVIAEVESKVRSLARQRHRAQRWEELRARRLAVELAVVRRELDTIEGRLREVEETLSRRGEDDGAVAAELGAAEAALEARRVGRVEAERARGEAVAGLEAVRTQLVRWEKDLAVAQERAAHGERRLEQLDGERRDSRRRAQELSSAMGVLARAEGELQVELDALRDRLAAARERSGALRDRLGQTRQRLAAHEDRERAIARRIAQLDGDGEAAAAQAAELTRHLERLSEEVQSASDTLSELSSQGDLFADRLDRLGQGVAAAREGVERAEAAAEDARARLTAAREVEREAEDRAAALAAQCSVLEAMDRDRDGLEPVIAAALDAAGEDALGTLADSLQVAPALARAVELYLGPLLHGIVVRDRRAAARLRRWFAESWGAGGGLILLPLDAAPVAGVQVPLAAGIEARGAGEPWVRAMLAGVEVVGEEQLLDAGARGAPRLAPSGASVDAYGVVRLGNPLGAGGVLERRERLRTLKGDALRARVDDDGARARRERAEAELRAREQAVREARDALRIAEDELRQAEVELAAQTDHRARMDRHRSELSRQLEGTRAARDRALERGAAARRDQAALEVDAKAAREAREAARSAVEQDEAEWEGVREEEAELGVALARLEGEHGRIAERRRDAESARVAAAARAAALDEEEVALRRMLAEVTALRERGVAELERLFAERDAAEAELRECEMAYAAAGERVDEAERSARAARTAERTAAEERHRLELERQNLAGQQARIRERIQGEWGRSLDALLAEAQPADGEPEALRTELDDLLVAISRLGPINMLAMEEYEEESRRVAFLKEQRADLVNARDDLKAAIRRINETATRIFQETFGAIRTNFQGAFRRLFEGGEADLWLSEPDDPLESPIEIYASPRGKRTQRIDLLSGGERALTALALLFGIYLVKPSPFCVLDEVDAPLDESNIDRFLRLLQEFKQGTQFVVITHNPRTIEAADWIYGVTMDEPGVSTIVGVRLDDELPASDSAA
ncbi:MAG: chromosome segregation protein SMC [Gemmatimonadetes bacterium]|nr:chromosome segregation protein SMC [Gemmatimonadota bacterium]